MQEGPRKIIKAEKARQAERGPSVRIVLIVSLSLVIIAFSVVYFIYV